MKTNNLGYAFFWIVDKPALWFIFTMTLNVIFFIPTFFEEKRILKRAKKIWRRYNIIILAIMCIVASIFIIRMSSPKVRDILLYLTLWITIFALAALMEDLIKGRKKK